MNIVMLSGRLTKDPDIRQTQSGSFVASYTLAVDRGDKDGNTDFINCKAFGKPAEFVRNYLFKGMKIIVEGKWQTGSYEKDGRRVYTNDCIVLRHEFCERKGTTNGSENMENPVQMAAPTQQNLQLDDFNVISDGDLPF